MVLPMSKLIKIPPICPSCKSIGILVDSTVVYPNERIKKDLWVCLNYPECDNYASAHKVTKIPLGTMAGPELRRLRHEAFESLGILCEGANAVLTYSQVYAMLAEEFRIDEADSRIGLFSEEQCRKVPELIENFWDRAMRLKKKRSERSFV